MPTPPRVALPPPRRACLMASFVAALAGLVALALLIDPAAPAAWEVDLARSIQEIGGPGWTPFIDVTEFLSRPLVVSLLAAAIGLACLRWGRRREAAMLAGALLVWAPERLITELVARERPTEAALVDHPRGLRLRVPQRPHDGRAGHLRGAAADPARQSLPAPAGRARRLRLAVAGLAGAAVGRVALGAHWPTDVLGAALLSGCWLIALHWADRRWLAPQSTSPVNRAEALDCPGDRRGASTPRRRSRPESACAGRIAWTCS